ncbi:hypothetical protein WISP_139464 [Willisornis vidua]|uniref:Uncharacterized protein n=1 Tax=Willisornis vidua TaxID=1566151 RepID=A0ABQ9CRV6_9PASS|nr:hypothetical protein WISP_139464 [Willisornis vidua]
MHTALEVQPHQCRVQWNDSFPSPAGHAVADTSQDATGLLGHLGTLLDHVHLAVNQYPQVLFHRAGFQTLFPQSVALPWFVVTQVQDLALHLIEPHKIGLGPLSQPAQILLQSLSALQQTNIHTQLGVICKLAKSALDPLIQMEKICEKMRCELKLLMKPTSEEKRVPNSISHEFPKLKEAKLIEATVVSEGEKEAEESHGKKWAQSGFAPLCMMTKRPGTRGTEQFTKCEKGSTPAQRKSRGGNRSLRYNPILVYSYELAITGA